MIPAHGSFAILFCKLYDFLPTKTIWHQRNKFFYFLPAHYCFLRLHFAWSQSSSSTYHVLCLFLFSVWISHRLRAHQIKTNKQSTKRNTHSHISHATFGFLFISRKYIRNIKKVFIFYFEWWKWRRSASSVKKEVDWINNERITEMCSKQFSFYCFLFVFLLLFWTFV